MASLPKKFSVRIILGINLCAAILWSQVSRGQSLSFSSQICGTNQSLSSNAYAFNYQGHTLVLASADYVLNSPAACHTAGGKNLRLIETDWGTGLALLEPSPTAPRSPSWPDATEIKWAPIAIMKKVTVAGASGITIADKSDRHHYPFQDSMLEISRVELNRNQFAVSLPVFDYKNPDQIVGFVSNQFVEPLAGGGTRVSRWTDTNLDFIGGPLLAFRADRVKAWIDKVLSSSQEPLFSVDPQAQLKRKQKITWGPLAFSENCPPPFSGGDNSNYPIGGGDPWGIGGTDRFSPSCKFLIELNSNFQDSVPSQEKSAWIQQIVTLLKENKTVEVYLGYRRQDELLFTKGFISIGDFFKEISRGNLKFAVMLEQPAAALSPLQKKARELRLLSRDSLINSNSGSFRTRAYLIGLLLEGPSWQEVRFEDLQNLRKDSPWTGYDVLIDDITQELRKLRP